MTKAVFTTRIDPSYDDRLDQRYHFPRTYLGQAEKAVGDWVVYYEPRRAGGGLSSGGRQAYFATARVTSIIRDPKRDDHFYALLNDFLEFEHPAPFRQAGKYYESGLQRDDGQTNKGAFGRSVRTMPDVEFDAILAAGFGRLFGSPTAEPEHGWVDTLQEETEPYDAGPVQRSVVEQLTRRPFRDVAFRASVRAAYDNTCAITGLRILNGGGRPEVQAAHIRPVSDGGSDSVRNGLALSATVHWMFDRGLISVDEDESLLTARDKMPDALSTLLRPDRKLLTPARAEEKPHPDELRYHRETVFKG